MSDLSDFIVHSRLLVMGGLTCMVGVEYVRGNDKSADKE